MRRSERDRLIALHRDAAEWFHANLMRREIGAGAREYLKMRGVNSEIAARWQLGFAPESWDAVGNWADEAGYSAHEMIKAGLAIARDAENRKSKIENRDCYSRFRNRLMFPIRSDYGDVIAFSGRTLGDDPAKYVNSPETLIFTKGRVLFGLDKSKRAIIDAKEAIVCEGQLDLIAAFEAGIQNVTAPQGTAFTPEQARMLMRLGESVVLCFDSDEAGRKAVERSLPALLASGLNVKVARIPAGEDPDSLIRGKGPDAFRAVIAAAKDYFENALDEHIRADSTPRERAALSRQLAGFVRMIGDQALREAVAQRVRQRLELTDTVFDALMKSAPRFDAEPVEDDSAASGEIEMPEAARLLCRLAILSPEAREWMRSRSENIPEEFGQGFRVLHSLVSSGVALEDPSALSAFSATLSAAEERAIAGLQLGKKPPADPVNVVAEAWRGLKATRIREQITAFQAKMRLPNVELSQQAELHKQILDLQKRLEEC